MASATSTVTPIMDDFTTRELLTRNIKRDLRHLIILTAESTRKHSLSANKYPVCWSEVKALLPLPVDKSLAMMLVADSGVIEHWDV